MSRNALIMALIIPLFFLVRLGLKEKHYHIQYGFWASVVSIVVTIFLIIVSYFI
jgi:amino acid permease